MVNKLHRTEGFCFEKGKINCSMANVALDTQVGKSLKLWRKFVPKFGKSATRNIQRDVVRRSKLCSIKCCPQVFDVWAVYYLKWEYSCKSPDDWFHTPYQSWNSACYCARWHAGRYQMSGWAVTRELTWLAFAGSCSESDVAKHLLELADWRCDLFLVFSFTLCSAKTLCSSQYFISHLLVDRDR